jgi:hypothetical protein
MRKVFVPGAVCAGALSFCCRTGPGTCPARCKQSWRRSARRATRTALNWLRKGAGAVILADLAADRTAAIHEAFDEQARPRSSRQPHRLINYKRESPRLESCR